MQIASRELTLRDGGQESKVPIITYTSGYHESGPLFSDKPGNGYDFPVMPTVRDLLQGDDAKYL